MVSVPELKDLVTPKGARTEAVHNWYVFPHSFSPQLVDYLLERYTPTGERPHGPLLDMFSGGGTAVLRAKQLGLESTGLDIMPVSVAVGNAKLGEYRADEILGECERLIAGLPVGPAAPPLDVGLAALIFAPETLGLLFALRDLIAQMREASLRDFFTTALLHTAERTMSAVKAGGFTRNKPIDEAPVTAGRQSRAVPEATTADEAIEIFRNRVKHMASEATRRPSGLPHCRVSLGDARRVPPPPMPYRWVITSPPYPNRQDYTRVFAPELLLTHSIRSEDHKSLRYATLRSHLEAKPPAVLDVDYREPAQLADIAERLLDAHRRDEGNRRLQKEASGNQFYARSFDHRITRMIRGYFEDMHLVLRSLKPHLSADAHVCLVVSNVRHAGVTVEVDNLLAEVASRVGYRCLEILVARHRGNSAQQMKKYKRVPSRESVVVLVPETPGEG